MRPTVSLLLSTYLSDDYLTRYENNLRKLINIAHIELVHILNSQTKSENNFIRKMHELALTNKNNFSYVHKIVERENLYISWNRAIKLATGKYLAISNVDDLLYENGLINQIKFLENNNGSIYLVGGDQFVRTKNDLIKYTYDKSKLNFDKFNSMVCGSFMAWTNPTLLKSEHIYFDEQFKVAGDFDFQIRFSAKWNIAYLNIPFGEYLSIGKGLSTGSILQIIEGQVIYLRYKISSKLIPFSKIVSKIYNYSIMTTLENGISKPVVDITNYNSIIHSNLNLKKEVGFKYFKYYLSILVITKIIINKILKYDRF